MTAAADPLLSRAVLIGTGRYKKLGEIGAVHNNLAALADVLRADRFWGLPPRSCVVVEDPETTAEMLDPVVEAAQDATDTLLMYYAGHGLVDPRRSELHLALTGSDPQRIYTAVPYTNVRDALLESRAVRRIVILDCCYSGRALGQMTASASAVVDEAGSEGTYVLAATAENRAALAPPGERYTAFTAELLAIIHNGIDGYGPLLDLDSLYRHVLAAMRSKGLPIPQKRDRNTAGQLTLFRNQAFKQPAPVRKEASTQTAAVPDAGPPPAATGRDTPPIADPGKSEIAAAADPETAWRRSSPERAPGPGAVPARDYPVPGRPATEITRVSDHGAKETAVPVRAAAVSIVGPASAAANAPAIEHGRSSSDSARRAPPIRRRGRIRSPKVAILGGVGVLVVATVAAVVLTSSPGHTTAGPQDHGSSTASSNASVNRVRGIRQGA